ncbi:hypothetical protein MGG_17788 [Pyricularia oryzae 70-15]|uniref:Uncharacterized protein n=1 Tax=Pyricularia oryzae (strain 70-15 / ATCC MYA-4617 / FGSC 8958) TaxID=242507 RepID=G4NHX8_PYRO7|nr:uncharacterized protein MGG_17788 [Pyricularia oryzae 70-15]EHA47838.1 hypothetical protein MGG_17788 [Pyricularia oryzae 70-15]
MYRRTFQAFIYTWAKTKQHQGPRDLLGAGLRQISPFFAKDFSNLKQGLQPWSAISGHWSVPASTSLSITVDNQPYTKAKVAAEQYVQGKIMWRWYQTRQTVYKQQSIGPPNLEPSTTPSQS